MKTIILTSLFSLMLITAAGFNNETCSNKLNVSVLNDSIPAYDTVKIGDIVSDPAGNEGRLCLITGKYGGWADPSIKCDTGPLGRISKSDYIIYDETGCIYVRGVLQYIYKEKELKPTDKDCLGADLIIIAYVFLKEGKPIMVSGK